MKNRTLMKYVNVSDILSNPEPATSFNEVHKAYVCRVAAEIVDEAQLRQQQDWSHLANLVVGAEDLFRDTDFTIAKRSDLKPSIAGQTE